MTQIRRDVLRDYVSFTRPVWFDGKWCTEISAQDLISLAPDARKHFLSSISGTIVQITTAEALDAELVNTLKPKLIETNCDKVKLITPSIV